MDKLKILTVFRSGPEWHSYYVHNFKKCLDKNITIPHEFICISDVELDNIKTLPLLPQGAGFWAKLQLFRSDLNLSGPCLYFDLDTIIMRNIDPIVEACYDHDFVMLEDPWQGDQSGSAFMWWKGNHSQLWDEYITREERHWAKHYNRHPKFGDQGFILDRIGDHKQIQHIIKDPRWIVPARKRPADEHAKIQIWGGVRRKPWLNPAHPDVSKYWI